MKKSFVIMTVVLLSIITLAGCGTTKTVYETDTAKTDELQSQIDELNEYITELKNQINKLSEPDKPDTSEPCHLSRMDKNITRNYNRRYQHPKSIF